MKKTELNYYWVVVYRLLIVLLLFSLCRFIFYWLNTGLFPGISAVEWKHILQGGLKFDIGALFYYNGLVIFLFLLPLPVKWRFNKVYQTIIKALFYTFNGVAILLNMIDCVYYRFTLRRTTLSVIREFQHEQNGGKLIRDFLMDYWYMTVIFAALIWLMVFLYNRVTPKIPGVQKSYRYFITASLFLVCGVLTAVAGIRGDFRHSTRPYTISNAGAYVSKPNHIYLVLNTPFVLVRTAGQKGLTKVSYFTEEELSEIYRPIHIPDSSAAFNKKNVVLILLESFGKEASGFYNPDLDDGTYTGYTPFLDSLAQQSLIFWNSFANGRKSIDAIPSCMAGIPAGNTPFVLTPYVSDSIKSMAHLLREEGYHTSFFHGAPNGSMGFTAITKLLGIDHYYGKNEFNNDKEFDGIWGIWDEPFFQYFGQTLNTLPQPFFSTVFSVSSHHPFKVPAQYQGVFKKGPLPVYECTGYTDMALKKFFQSVEKETWFKNTLFVITADHATVTHHPEYNNAWGDIAIPILLYAPGDPEFKGVYKDRMIQQIDIMPTVLGYLQYNKPFLSFGNNVLGENEEDKDFTFCYNGEYRWFYRNYVLFSDGEAIKGLYDYRDDRLLTQNIAGEQKELAEKMFTRLRAFIQQYNNRLIDNKLTVQ